MVKSNGPKKEHVKDVFGTFFQNEKNYGSNKEIF